MKRVLFTLILLTAGISAYAQGGFPGGPPGGPGGGLGPGQGAGRGQRPARAQPQADAPRGTSVLRGQIVAADNGAPIRRAQIRIAAPDARESRVATTDAQGRFEIKELPAGRYTVTASKGGFVSLQFGQRRPTESGTPIELGDNQTIDKITIALPRGSVLGGRITDEFGEPVANAVVTAFRYAYVGGARRLQPAGPNARDTTDDQGHYRLFGLPPGDYYVSAILRSGGPEAADPSGEVSGYASTYYPGTPNVGEAAAVKLALAQENSGVNFALIATKLVRVSGQMLTSDGTPAANGVVMLMPAGANGRPAVALGQGGAGNRVDPTGAFRIANVAPGRYQVIGRAGGRDFELARMDLTVGTDDVEGLTLVTAAAASITGNVINDTGEPMDFRASQLQITARSASPDGGGAGPGFGPGAPPGRVGDDWTFALRNITDPVLIRATAPQGWTLKAVTAGGQDITDMPIEVPAGQTLSGVQVVLTKKVSALSGLVTDAKGTPVLDATVVVFPADEKLWTFQSRFIKAARPDQDGRYQIGALPAQSYFVVALQGLEDGQAGDPDFLASVRDQAAKFELGDGETKAVDVKLSALK